MGTLFRLIADSALVAEDAGYYTECQVCGQAVPVYGAPGTADCGELERHVDVYVACAPCIMSGRIDQISKDQSFRATIRGACSNADRARSAEDLLNRTPLGLPCFMQGKDWPMCCDAPTEFLGAPDSFEALVAFAGCSREWDHGLGGSSTDFVHTGPPEGLRDVKLFECASCQFRYFLFQPT